MLDLILVLIGIAALLIVVYVYKPKKNSFEGCNSCNHMSKTPEDDRVEVRVYKK